MIGLSIIFAIAGLLLIFAEFYLPGGIVGGIGGLLMISGFVIFASTDIGPIWIFAYVIIAAALLTITIRLALHRIQSSKSKNTLYLNQDQEGFRASSFDEDLIGKQGIATSSLKPSGHIQIDGKHYQAVSLGRFIEKETPIEIVRGEGARFIVKSLKKQEKT